MKKMILLMCAAIMMAGFQSCIKEDDGYSIGKYWVTTATIYTGEYSPYVIVTDNGDKLFPSSTAVPRFTIKDGQRVWISYTILGDAEGDLDHYVKVNDLLEILTKGILELTPENADSIGYDPVRIREYWFTDDYLTIRFVYGGGGKVHFINLVQDVDNPVNDDGLPVLEFRHNRNNDPYNYRMRGTVSFKLNDLQVSGEESIQFVLKAKPFEDHEPFEKILTYTYGE
jgi:hypothetical protein